MDIYINGQESVKFKFNLIFKFFLISVKKFNLNVFKINFSRINFNKKN